ncbi:uncharacterized protein [Penaeus vannamei]|uniref:uncharacterized protein n=1 Tax=Penaeus vannamei TaxID=6689 RepID=UPI00387F9372
MDHILALRVIVEHHCEFGHGLLTIYIDLKVFDMVHKESLWEILRLRGIPTRIIGLTASAYCHCGATLANINVTDLDFVDAILSETLESLVAALDAFNKEPKPLGLEVSFADLLGKPARPVHTCGEDIEVTESFTYLGSVLVQKDQAMQSQAKLIMPVLLYGSETWTLSCTLKSCLDALCNWSFARS